MHTHFFALLRHKNHENVAKMLGNKLIKVTSN